MIQASAAVDGCANARISGEVTRILYVENRSSSSVSERMGCDTAVLRLNSARLSPHRAGPLGGGVRFGMLGQ
jgi:hypothetical protein